jgi:rhamnose transport system substrate-binding protein
MVTRKLVLLNIVLVVMLALSACAGPATPAPVEAPQQPDPTTVPEQPEAASTVKIAYIPQNSGNPYFERINFGFQQVCAELDCEVEFTAPASPEATSQIPFIQAQVQRGIDVLAIQANSVDALNSIFDDVRSNGIPVIATNAELDGNESHRDAAVLAVDFDTLGGQMLDRVYDIIGPQGKFAILSATTDAPAQRKWIEEPGGIKELLENDPKYQEMVLLEVAYGDDVPQKSLTECEALLTKYPEMEAILAPTTVAIAAAAQCVESAGVYPGGPAAEGNGVVVYGLGTPNQMRPFLKSGVIEDFDLWDPAHIGMTVATMAYGLERGTITLGEGNTFEVPGLGTMTFLENNLVLVGPLFTFTQENIDDFDF